MFLRRNPNLVRLGIAATHPLQGIGPKILDTVVQLCPWVTELEFSSMVLDGKLLERVLLNLAPRLTRLKLEWCRPLDQSNPWKDWPTFPHLRDPDVVRPPDLMPWEDQLQLFTQAPNLESGRCCCACPSTTAYGLCDPIQPRPCRKSERITSNTTAILQLDIDLSSSSLPGIVRLNNSSSSLRRNQSFYYTYGQRQCIVPHRSLWVFFAFGQRSRSRSTTKIFVHRFDVHQDH